MWSNQYSFVKTIQKSVITNTFQYQKTSGFPGNSILLARNFITIIQNTLHIYVFEIIHASTYGSSHFDKQKSFQKISDFLGFTNYTNHFITTLLMNSPTFHMLTFFQNNLYSQVTGKRKGNMK